MTARRGRPPLGLDLPLTVRLSSEQSAYLDRRSEQEDRAVSDVVRRILDAEMARHPLPERTLAEVLLAELDRR